MGFNLPASVVALITGDSATTRSLTSIKNAVDPLLQVVGSTFEILSDGTLRIKRSVKGLVASDPFFSGLATFAKLRGDRLDIGTLVAYAAANFTQGFTSTGVSTFRGSVIIQKLADLTQGGILVQGNASVQGNLNTATGVKTALGHYGYSGNAAATTYYTLGAAFFTTNAQMVMPFAGSLVGMSICVYGQATTTIQTFVSGLTPSEYRFDCALTNGATQSFNYTLARGAYSFVAGNILQFKVYSPVAINAFSFSMLPIVEYQT